MNSKLDRFTELMAEIRRRVIVDFYTGTSALDADHYATCRLCGWMWLYGAEESHEPSCPLETLRQLEKKP